MNKELAVRQMLSRYNRRMDDDTIRNYMDACRDYTNEDVIQAVNYLTSAMERLPYPRDLEQYLSKEGKGNADRRVCDRCGGPGYYKEDFEKHQSGLLNLEPAKWVKCYCKPKPDPGVPELASKANIRNASMAKLLGEKIGMRAIDGEVIHSIEEWGFYCWTAETYNRYLELGKKITLNSLLHVDELLEKHSPTDCQTRPLEILADIVKKAALMKPKKWVKTIGKRS